jgi:hypothetical protein
LSHQKKPVTAFLGCLGFLSVAGAAAAPLNTLPDTLGQAIRIADQVEEGPVADYGRGPFMAYYGPRYANIANQCIRSLRRPDLRSLDFVFVLNAQGTVERIYRNRDTNLFACLREQLSKDHFPAPPVSPYFAHFKIEFPPKQLAPQK